MPTTYKPAQAQGTAAVTTYATLYSCPSATSAIISSIAICNTSSTAATYRIGIMGSAGTPGASEWVIYDASVTGNDTVFITTGLALDAGKYLRISSSANTVAFSAHIAETV